MTVDRTAQLLDRLPEQYKEKPNWEGFLTDIAAEFQALEDVHQDLLTLRSLPTATGAQLEVLGSLVGEPPTAHADDIYRRRIQARIATNRSRGTADDLIRIARLILTDGVTTPTITVANRPPGEVLVHIAGAEIDDAVADELIKFLRAAVKGGGAAGVRVVLETSEYPPEERFSFEGGPGLGYGIGAQMDLATHVGTVITRIDLRDVGAAGNAYTFALVDDGAGVGSLTNSGTDYVFHYAAGLTTRGNLETAIAGAIAVMYVAVNDPFPGATLLSGQAFGPVPFANGADGGRYSDLRG